MWKFQPQGDGRILRLMDGDRVVLTIDRSRLIVRQTEGDKSQRIDVTVGQGDWPFPEDQERIESLLNGTTEAAGENP